MKLMQDMKPIYKKYLVMRLLLLLILPNNSKYGQAMDFAFILSIFMSKLIIFII